jgi:ribonuclease T1
MRRYLTSFCSRFSLLLAVILGCQMPAQAFHLPWGETGGLPQISVAALPPEARETLQLIKQGGPFPYDRDGVVFGNYEHVLPKQPRGYYHEYTVKTPGVRNRGARRIVCGERQDCYYSGDHYKTFQRIGEGK